MNEHETKKLIEKSALQTSDTFTNALMERVAVRKGRAKALQKAIVMACVLSGILLIMITWIPSNIGLFRLEITLPPLFIKVMGTLFAFITLNKLLSLRTALH